jgi:hypothetical protein
VITPYARAQQEQKSAPPQSCSAGPCEQKPKETQTEPALPPAPSATLKTEIEQGIKAQPPCDSERYPCRLTPRQKFNIFLHRTYSPYTFFDAGVNAAWSQWTGEPYGEGWGGFAKRYGANLADGEARAFFQTFLLSTAFGQDPRYHRMGRGPLFYRAAYAVSRVLIGRTDDGRNTFNAPEFLGTAMTISLSNLYHPRQDRGFGRGVSIMIGSIGSDASSNILREFWPDVRRILQRHEPKSVQKLEQKVQNHGLTPKDKTTVPAEGEELDQP